MCCGSLSVLLQRDTLRPYRVKLAWMQALSEQCVRRGSAGVPTCLMQTSNELPQQPGAAGAAGGEARRGADGAPGEQPSLGANMSFNSTLMAALMGHVPSSDAPLTLDSQVGPCRLACLKTDPPHWAPVYFRKRCSVSCACSSPTAHVLEPDARLMLSGSSGPGDGPERAKPRTCWHAPPQSPGSASAATPSSWLRSGTQRVHAGGPPGCTVLGLWSRHVPPRGACTSFEPDVGRLGERFSGRKLLPTRLLLRLPQPRAQVPTAAGAQPAAARPRASGAAGGARGRGARRGRRRQRGRQPLPHARHRHHTCGGGGARAHRVRHRHFGCVCRLAAGLVQG